MTNKISEHKDLLLFEDYFFKELQNSPNSYFLKQEEKLKNIIASCTAKVLQERESQNIRLNKTRASLIIENDYEKKHFLNEIHNSLQQILASLNFFVDAIKHPSESSELRKAHLDKITKLGQDAFELSKNISDTQVFNSLKNKGFILSIKELFCNTSFKHNTFIDVEFDINFNEALLSKLQKHQIYNTSKDILNHLANNYKSRNLIFKYSFKYRNNILQIDINMKGSVLSKTNLEMQVTIGYNNLKHKLSLLKARLYERENNKLTVKIPIKNKNNLTL